MLEKLDGWKKIIAAFFAIPLMIWMRKEGAEFISDETFYGIYAYIVGQGVADATKGAKK